MTTIRGDCIRTPATPTPRSFAPPNSVAKKVGDRDSWDSLAKQFNMDAWQLIRFNYPNLPADTRIAALEVNWYLQQYVGCRNVTQDGRNYMFSNSANPGFIYVPSLLPGKIPEIRPPDPPKVTAYFRIKMHANLNISQFLAGDFSIFQIWDPRASLCSFYTYWAGGVSAGFIPGAWLSATLSGPWNDFYTSDPLAVNQFAGPTRFSTAGAGPWTENVINFMGLPGRTMTVPNPLRINTGFTIGIGAGTSTGILRLELLGTPDGLLPFKGP
jgi:hypothetical protein